jgi:hypothetical protein
VAGDPAGFLLNWGSVLFAVGDSITSRLEESALLETGTGALMDLGASARVGDLPRLKADALQ